jgi:hypothetical protein
MAEVAIDTALCLTCRAVANGEPALHDHADRHATEDGRCQMYRTDGEFAGRGSDLTRCACRWRP